MTQTNPVQDQIQPQQNNFTGTSEQPSRFDLFSGRHTTALIVSILYIITLVCFLIFLVYVRDKLPIEVVVTGFISLLSGLAGFFAGSTIRRDK